MIGTKKVSTAWLFLVALIGFSPKATLAAIERNGEDERGRRLREVFLASAKSAKGSSKKKEELDCIPLTFPTAQASTKGKHGKSKQGMKGKGSSTDVPSLSRAPSPFPTSSANPSSSNAPTTTKGKGGPSSRKGKSASMSKQGKGSPAAPSFFCSTTPTPTTSVAPSMVPSKQPTGLPTNLPSVDSNFCKTIQSGPLGADGRTMIGRIGAGFVPTSCDVVPFPPAFIGDQPRFFEEIGPFVNTSPDFVCITVTIDVGDCVDPNTGNTLIHTTAFTSFDPPNISENYLGDVGDTNENFSFQFRAPGNSEFVIVAQQILDIDAPDNGNGCVFSIVVDNGNCP